MMIEYLILENLNNVFYYIVFFIFISILSWILYKFQQKQIWFPVLEILKKFKTPKPKYVFKKPPLVSFISFMLISFLLLFWSMRPSNKEFDKVDSEKNNLHLFVDLSPSIALYISITDYRKMVNKVVKQLIQNNSVSISSSFSDEVIAVNKITDIKRITDGFNFHPAGVVLSNSISKIIQQKIELKSLILLSDFNYYSWHEFNWSYISKKIKVFNIDVTQNQKSLFPANYYVVKANRKKTQSHNLRSWQIYIARDVINNDTNLASQKVTLNAYLDLNRAQLISSVEAEFELNSKLLIVDIDFEKNLNESEYITWSIDIDSNETNKLDNIYTTINEYNNKSILIQAPVIGENFLDDPMYNLAAAFRVLGYKVDRVNSPLRAVEIKNNYSIIVLAAGHGDNYKGGFDYCKRLIDYQKTNLVMLIPHNFSLEYKNICNCNVAMTNSQVDCEDVLTKVEWNKFLKSSGARKIGGELGSKQDAVAWLQNSANVNILNFVNSPITTHRIRGSLKNNYINLPLFFKSVLEISNTLSNKKSTTWPTYKNIAALEQSVKLNDKFYKTNITAGESTFKTIAKINRPPSWGGRDITKIANFIDTKQGVKNPVMWLQVLFLCFVLLVSLDVLFLFFRSQYEKQKGQ